MLSVERLGRTTSLNLAKQGISTLPDDLLKNALEDVSTAENLDLSDNNLSSLGNVLDPIAEQLSNLDLSRNAFLTVPKFIPSLCRNLKVLSLQNNQIAQLPPEFGTLWQLEELYLCQNKLKEFPPIQNMNFLSILDVSFNNITEIDPNHIPNEYSNIEELYISNNNLQSIPEKIIVFTNLLILDLSNNMISEIYEAVSALKELQELRLENNKISRLPVGLTQLKKLVALKVTSSTMSCPPGIVCKKGCAAIMSYLSQLQQPSLSPNCSKKDRRLSRQSAFSLHDLDGCTSSPDISNNDITKVLLNITSLNDITEPIKARARTRTHSSFEEGESKSVKIKLDKHHRLIALASGFYPNDFAESKEMDAQFRLQSQERYSNYYENNIMSKEHYNYVGVHPKIGNFILSLLKEIEDGHIVGLMISSEKNSVLRVPLVLMPQNRRFSYCGKSRLYLTAVRNYSDVLAKASINVINDSEFTYKVVLLEKKLLVCGYKFGIVNIREGQTKEEEFYGNTEVSEDYMEFLRWLGDRVNLKTFKGYTGGLPKNWEDDSWETVVTNFASYDIAFHCANLLPHSSFNEQQLERKRFIGNDIVVILFKESSEPIDISVMKSEFNHVFLVIQPLKDENNETCYHVEYIAKKGVAQSLPLLHYPPIFKKTEFFRAYLLTKLINLERAAYEAPNFIKKIERTRKALLDDMIKDFDFAMPRRGSLSLQGSLVRSILTTKTPV